MAEISLSALAAFRAQGYVVIPGVLDERQRAFGSRTAAAMLTAQPPAAGHTGPYFLWPRFGPAGDCGHDHGLLRFYRQSGIAELAAALLRPDLPPDEPDFAQLATTIPPWPHRPGGPHVGGLSLRVPHGQAETFSILAGAWLTDHAGPDRGNLWVWPGTHLRFGEYLTEHGADALGRLPPDPPIEVGEPLQVTGEAGSVLFAHYLLAHDIGGYDGPPGAPVRQVVYYRLLAQGHRARWRDAVASPLAEFRAAA